MLNHSAIIAKEEMFLFSFQAAAHSEDRARIVKPGVSHPSQSGQHLLVGSRTAHTATSHRAHLTYEASAAAEQTLKPSACRIRTIDDDARTHSNCLPRVIIGKRQAGAAMVNRSGRIVRGLDFASSAALGAIAPDWSAHDSPTDRVDGTGCHHIESETGRREHRVPRRIASEPLVGAANVRRLKD
jgi:hypothetical protein